MALTVDLLGRKLLPRSQIAQSRKFRRLFGPALVIIVFCVITSFAFAEFDGMTSIRLPSVFQILTASLLKILGIIQWLTGLLARPTRADDGGVRFGEGKQTTSNPLAIADQCHTFLALNRRQGTAFGHEYSFNMPSHFKYSPSQWLWDSGAHEIAWAALGRADLAVADLRSLLNFVLDNGRVPEQINWRAGHMSWFDRVKTLVQYSKVEYNDLTQMPVLPYSLRAIFNATGDVSVLAELVPKMVTYFKWLRDSRDLDQTGVISILHPWESGLDLSPAYDQALGLDPSARANPPWSALYPKLISLNMAYKFQYGWDQRRILQRPHSERGPFSWFKVQDVAFNSVYASGWGILGDLASHFDEPLAAECYENRNKAEKGILDSLFSQEHDRFVTGYKDRGNVQQYHDVKTVQVLFPLLLKSIKPQQVEALVTLLTDENEFWTPAAVPSVSKAEVEYSPIWDTDLLWRGPTWGFTNWFIMEGLERQGKTEVLERLMDKWVQTVKTSGIYEMYNPDTGIGYGAEGLGMSCLIVDWMKRLGRI